MYSVYARYDVKSPMPNHNAKPRPSMIQIHQAKPVKTVKQKRIIAHLVKEA